MTRRLRLLIADGTPTREGIRIALDGEVDVCGEAEHTEQAIRVAKRVQPDVCLVGEDLAGGALAAIRGVSRAAPNVAVTLCTESQDVDYLLASIRAGAIGYIPRSLDAEGLRRVLHAIASREAVVPRSMVLELLLELRGEGAGTAALTARESQVLRMLRRKRTTAEIANRLGIAPVTVRRHISQVMSKLGVEHRAALIGDQDRS